MEPKRLDRLSVRRDWLIMVWERSWTAVSGDAFVLVVCTDRDRVRERRSRVGGILEWYFIITAGYCCIAVLLYCSIFYFTNLRTTTDDN